ncbi:MAG: LysM peptidoglycan-binding domain-containing protein [Rhodospirillaceae bacterium]|nr:LysM peptidoglycan-binding domain-containing protein [Rhodospirillaceae bacterium]
MSILRSALTLATIVLLSACAPKFEPPPGFKGGFLWDVGRSRTVEVQAGDTLYTISRRYNVPTKAIIARNGLKAPYELKVGQQLLLDPAMRHKIDRGDTLSKLARQYGVEMRLIADANELAPPYIIAIGQTLWIPDPFTAAAAPVIAPSVPVASAGGVSRPTVTPGVSASPRSSAIAVESLPPPAGQLPQVQPTQIQPRQGQPPSIQSQPVAPPQFRQVPPPAEAAPIAEPQERAIGSVRPAVESADVSAQTASLPPEPAPLTLPPPRAAARFVWPLKGKVISGFGPSGKGLHNDGINIAAVAGAQVKAADNGVVAYAGNELKGFGNLLLIKHSDGWITAYAHNDKLLVKRGDEIQQGQVISTVGRTGNVDAPQLHFEIRQGTQSVDPMAHLEPLG